MSKTKIVVDTNVSLLDYMALVDSIVDAYFDIDGEYQPQYGMINTMALFYKGCVIESELDSEVPHDFDDIMLVEKLARNEDFIREFNEATSYDGYGLTFNSAYNDAMDIITQKKMSHTYSIDAMKKAILEMINSVSDIMTQDNIDAAVRIAHDVREGKIDYSSIIAGFNNSPEFDKIISSGEKDHSLQDSGKVIPFPNKEPDEKQ